MHTAIYEPPERGLPYLLVTFSPGGPTVREAKTRQEARMLLMEHTNANPAVTHAKMKIDKPRFDKTGNGVA
jgi:hypothetical protein